MHENSCEAISQNGEFEQAVLAELEATNPEVANWVKTTIVADQSSDETLPGILSMDGLATSPDPDDSTTVKRVATAIEFWVSETQTDAVTATVDNHDS